MNKFFLPAIFLLIPSVVFAINNVFDAENFVIQILGKLGYFFWMLALAAFFWGLVKFINNAADTEAHEKGKHLMIWGIISFLVLVSLWTIVTLLLGDTIGYSPTNVNYVDKNGTTI